MQVKVMDLDNKEHGALELSSDIFGVDVREDILHRVVEWQRAKRRAGTHKVKLRGEVSGTTKKPWRQKGTGRARLGSMKSAQCVGGGIIFGPVVRSHAYKLPKKVRELGLRMALSAKFKSGNLVVLKNTSVVDAAKTKDVVAKLKKLDIKSALIIEGVKGDEKGLTMSVRNIPHIDIIPVMGANVYDMLKHDKLFITESAVKLLEERLK